LEPLDLRAPGPTAPPTALGLSDRFQRRLELIPAGRILFDLTVEEEYDDNAFAVGDDREEDFRTVIVPAIGVERVKRKSSLRLRYTPRILRHARFSELDRVDHSLVAATSWNPTPKLRISVQESLLITEDPVAASALGIRDPGVRRTTRNEVSPDLQFRLSPRSDLLLGYTHTFIDADDDAMIHRGRIVLRHRRPRSGLSLAYTLTSAEFDESSDFLGHEGNLNASWRLNPRDELLFTGGGVVRDRDEDTDLTIITGSLGLRHQFSRRLSSTSTAGAQRFDEEGSDPTIGFFTDSNLTWTFPRGQLALRVERRFTETFSDVDNEGVVEVLRGSVSFSYRAGPRLFVSVDGSYAREDFEEQDRLDLINSVGVQIRYQLSRLLAFTAGYQRFDRNSDLDGSDLTTNRVFIGLSLSFASPI
jgi:hypothetical protein